MFAQTIYRSSEIFFKYSLDVPYELDRIPFPKQKKRLPYFFNYIEIEKLISNAANLKHKTILMIIYSSGLRVSEIVTLTSEDVLRDQMLLRINQSKGNKDRYTILSKTALEQLEKYWKAYRPQNYLFPGKGGKGQLSIRACQHAFEIAKINSGGSGKMIMVEVFPAAFSRDGP